ncbi:hypothetical protein E4U43_001720 [Claviceps pusilla]|uniref:Uncharacterized protein n=1 Tax=Claviceps pusilla TaxID=123648 RepID=A0A9P7SY07_9HYPO|nr:hypothetical protein E4U43_001720 [Claviceps pusilla]
MRNTEVHLKLQTVNTAPTPAPHLKGRDEGSGARGPWAGPQTAYLVRHQTIKMYSASSAGLRHETMKPMTQCGAMGRAPLKSHLLGHVSPRLCPTFGRPYFGFSFAI